MKFHETKKGQIIIALITAVAAVGASIIAAFATSNSRVSEIDKQVSIIQEREANHYQELQNKLDGIDKKIDQLIELKRK